MKLHVPSQQSRPCGMVKNEVVLGGLFLLLICFGCASCSRTLKCCGDYRGEQTCWTMRPEKGESEEDVNERCRQWGGNPKEWESGGIVSGILGQFFSDHKRENVSDVNPKVQETLKNFSRELNDSAIDGETHR